MNRRNLLQSSAAALAWPLLAGLPRQAAAADSGVARTLVGFPPGGSTDVVARAVAAYARDTNGRPIVVENLAGASGRLAVTRLASSPADGSVTMVAPAATMTLFPAIYRKLGYDPQRDFTPVTSICSFTFALIASNAALPAEVQSVADLEQWFKQNPGRASYASGGAGTPMHFVGVMLAKALGIELVHVPYKGATPMVQDLIGGQVPVGITVIGDALPHIEAGKLRALAVTSPQRSPHLPDVPTFIEAGAPDVLAQEWFGLFLPAGAPADAVARWHDTVAQALETDDVQTLLRTATYEPDISEPQAFADLLASERARWASVVKASGFSIEE